MYLLKSINKKALPAMLLGCLAATSLGFTNQVQACPNQPYIGGMCAFAGNFAPRNWLFANGSLLPISSNTAMFSLLGTSFGGDGRTTFGLPDLRGRAIVGVGRGPGLSNYTLGQKTGWETITLTVAQMPNHNHSATTTLDLDLAPTDVTVTASLNAHDGPGTSTAPSGNMLAQNAATNVYSGATPSVAMNANAIEASASGSVNATATTTVDNAGNNQAHENRMPYLAINWIVAQVGVYPSRN